MKIIKDIIKNTHFRKLFVVVLLYSVLVGIFIGGYYIPYNTLLQENRLLLNVNKEFRREFDSYKLVRLINSSRIENNLHELKLNDKLSKAAYLKAEDMFEHNYFEHDSPLGITPWDWFDKVNYIYADAGENLAKTYYTAEQTHHALMSSDSHRENILNENFSEIGIAVVYDTFNDSQTIIVVEMFGSEY